MKAFNCEDAFLIATPTDNTQPHYCEEWLKAEVTKAWLVNNATYDFLEGSIDEETFLDIVEACDQDMDEYVKIANGNLEFLLNG